MPVAFSSLPKAHVLRAIFLFVCIYYFLGGNFIILFAHLFHCLNFLTISSLAFLLQALKIYGSCRQYRKRNMAAAPVAKAARPARQLFFGGFLHTSLSLSLFLFCLVVKNWRKILTWRRVFDVWRSSDKSWKLGQLAFCSLGNVLNIPKF